jgi:hypothetical protein
MSRWTTDPGSELAGLRIACHRAYDPLWEFEVMARTEMYRRLAQLMGLPPEKCHFGMFDEAQCRLALSLRNRVGAPSLHPKPICGGRATSEKSQ